MAAVEPVTCASCGTINRPGAFFCAECGAALTREKPTSKQRTTYALSADDVKKALSTKIELPYTLPFAAGESPCMVKGGTYAGIMKQLATRVSGGIRNILPVIKDQGLTEFLSQRFLPGSYYDIFPLPIVEAYIAALYGMSFREFLKRGGAHLAKRDLEGTYRAILTAFTPEDVIDRMHRIGDTYYNWASPPPEFPEEHCAVVRRKMPALLCDWYEMFAMSYFEVVFAQTGAHIVEHERIADEKLPSEHGVEWVLHRRRVRWEST